MSALAQQLRISPAAGIRATSSSGTGSSSSSSVPAKQPEPASSNKSDGDATVEEWTEVIDEKSGQPYYWNQKTGKLATPMRI
jgi:hypothetical protein